MTDGTPDDTEAAYRLDALAGETEPPGSENAPTTGDADGCDSDASAAADEPRAAGESLGVTVPDDHVATFVAEAFEDVERDTDWATAVDTVVAEEARDAWAALSPQRQVLEVLEMAADYDRRALDRLDAVELAGGDLAGDDRERVDEALRCRRNADRLRDAVADAYSSGHVGDDALVAAVEAASFDTETVARREDRLDDVAAVYDVNFRPYGGTLFDVEDRDDTQDRDPGEVWS